ncbi:ASPRV1 [Cordylochernes scorpioides]|uniref:ASPRV1 n=1 Tax=Cordylochernes scorpioides TaxID=51811 RepID=A0ABY6LX03_9ARAC|nr:ASPRV1 [Cordylochernes scorpioides]
MGMAKPLEGFTTDELGQSIIFTIAIRIIQGLISTLQLVERLDRYPLRNKRKIDSVEPEETSMNVKKEGTQVRNCVVQHLPRNPSIFSGEDGEDLQKWLKGYAPEKKLKTRAQLKGESTECYIQDLLCLCKEVDPQMSEEDKISHLMKGIAEELYQALLPRDVQSTEQFITECRRVEALRCRRVTPTRYERLPNVASLCDQDDGEDLSSMIRQIVREEVQRALGSPREEPKNATIEEIVKEEIGRTPLAPISKSRRSPPHKERPQQFLNTRYEAETIRPHPEPRYSKQGGRRDTNDWRTTEGRPICFYCGRPGHVVRYCRDRKRHNEERINDYFQESKTQWYPTTLELNLRTPMTNHRGKPSLATEALLHIAVETDNISHLLEDLAGRPAIKTR